MKQFLAVAFLFGLSLACIYDTQRDAVTGRFVTRGPHWDYSEGLEGPSHWGDLEGYSACGSGKKQTPIDIASHSHGATAGYNIGNIEFHGHLNVDVQYQNNGHTVVITCDKENNVTGGPLFSDHYQLLQFHFHAPSEHTLNGIYYPLEVHFVHQNPATGDLAVVGVFFEIGTDENAWLKELFDYLPEYHEVEHRSETPVDTHHLNLNPYEGLPSDLSYYHYEGSLTTPPCTEGLKWIVLKEVRSISHHQLEQWEERVSHNNRPIQSLNGRTIFSDDAKASECPDTDGNTGGNTDGDNDGGNTDGGNGKSGSETVINFNFANMIPAY